MQIGRKIYFSKDSGVIIWDKGQMEGSVVETTLEEDKIAMPVLTLILEDKFGILQLNFGDYADEFSRCKGYIINPVTLLPEFVY
jgi:hypothetical protein